VDPARSTVTLSTDRITNDGQRVRILVSLRDTRGRPLAHAPVRIAPSRAFLRGAGGRTDSLGRFSAQLSVQPGAQHRQSSSGLVAFQIYASTQERPLRPAPRLRVYNRVAVLLQGLGTSSRCHDPACLPSMFAPLTDSVLQPLGYSAGSAAPTILQYSYRGGQMIAGTGEWRWQPQSYDLCDTMQPVAQSAQILRDMLIAYRTRYPYTTFELLGHSLGGLVAFEAAGDQGFLTRIGPQGIDKVITIDSPVNGITAFNAQSWLVDIAAGFTHLLGCRGQGFGFNLMGELSGLGDQSPGRQHQWAAAARAAGVAVLDITNRQDILVPEAYAEVDDGHPQSVVDRLLYDASSAQTYGHSALLYPTRSASQPNPVWNAFTATLRQYLGQPCLSFAAPDSACVYPMLDRNA
jgi:pimeloyl-ACP methyl ester carboxylesterase